MSTSYGMRQSAKECVSSSQSRMGYLDFIVVTVTLLC